MQEVFTRSRNTVMAGLATLADQIMVNEVDGLPIVRRVAAIALARRGEVVHGFAFSNGPVVAGFTTAEHLGMINPDNLFPGGGQVTVSTSHGSGGVIDRFAGGQNPSHIGMTKLAVCRRTRKLATLVA